MKATAAIFAIAMFFASQEVEGNTVSDMIQVFGGKIVEAVVNCTAEYDISFENIAGLFKYKFSLDAVPEPDESIQCAMTCVMKHFNVVDDNGKLLIEPLIDIIPDKEKRNKIKEEIGDCLKEAESKIDAEHKCGGLHYFGKCMFLKTIEKLKTKLCGQGEIAPASPAVP